MGAEHDPQAPWNQSDPEPRQYDCEVTVTLQKTMPVNTVNYIEEAPEYPDYFGGVDLSEVNWEDEYREQYYSVPTLLEKMADMLEALTKDADKRTRSDAMELIEEARGWEVYETEVTEA